MRLKKTLKKFLQSGIHYLPYTRILKISKMTQINYPTDFAPELTDLLAFTTQLTAKFGNQPVRVFVNRVRYNADREQANMKYVNVDFQVFAEGAEKGLGTHYTWESYRSINPGCGHSNIKQLTDEERNVIEVEYLSKRLISYTAEELACNKQAYYIMQELTKRLKEIYE